MKFEVDVGDDFVPTPAFRLAPSKSVAYTVIAAGLVLAVLRVVIGLLVEPVSPTWVDVYKDAAHLFMGGLAVAWLYDGYKWQKLLFWGLVVLEVVVAIGVRV